MALEDIADGRASNVIPQLEQLPVDLAVAPAGVLLRQLHKQRFELRSNRRPSGGDVTIEGPLAPD